MSRHWTWPAFAGLALLFSCTSLASAAAVRWGNSLGGSWNLPGNWMGGALPTATDTAVIDLAGDYVVTMNQNVNVAALRISGSSGGVQTLDAPALPARTLTLANASSIGAQGVLNLASATVNGAGAITNNGTLKFVGGTVAQAVTNNGTLTVNGSTSLSGAFANSAGAMLRVQGTTGATTLTVASGFTNSGAIELTSSGAATTATLSITTGTLVNAASGTVSSLVGSGGARNLTTRFDNQGLITVAQNTTTNKASVQSTNSGTIDLTTGNYTIVVSGTSPSFTTTGTINVPAGRTLTLQGGVVGGAGQNHNFNGGTMGGAGTVSLLNAQLNLNSALATSTTHLDVNSSIVAGPATLTCSAGTTTMFTSSTLSAPTVVETGATLQMVSSNHTGGTLTNSGLVEWTGANTSTGTFSTQPGSILRLSGTVGGNSSLTCSGGFTNTAAIELTSLGTTTTATLTVSAGILTNAASGTISSLIGSSTSGTRVLDAKLDNQGLITAQRNLNTSLASVDHVNSGTINLTTGNYTIGISGSTPTFTTTGTINVPAGRTLTLQGGVVGGLGQNFHFNGGTMGGAGTVSLLNSTLNLGAPVATSMARLDGNACIVNGPDTLTMSAGITTNFNSSTLNAPMKVETGATLQLVTSDQVGSLANRGLVEVTGACTGNAAFTNEPGATFRIIGTGSNASFTVPSGWFNAGTLELTSTGAATTASLISTTASVANLAGATLRTLAGAGGARQILAHFGNFGAMDVQANLTVSKAGVAHSNAGSIALGFGRTLTVTGTSFTNTTTGVISGTGFLNPSGATTFSQQGTLRPGASAGALSILDAVPMASTSVLDVEIGGNSPGNSYDWLAVQNALTVDGTLNISLINGYQPQPGTRYVIATCDGRSGTFDTITGLDYGVG